MPTELSRLQGLGNELTRRARAAGVLLIWRAQERSVRRTVVRDGRPESTGVIAVSGHGAQVITPDGRTALGSRDDFRETPALDLLDRVTAMAAHGPRLGLESQPLPELEPVRENHGHDPDPFRAIRLDRVASRLAELEAEVRGRVPGVTTQVSYRAELDSWRIHRTDGTDLLFSMPRCALSFRATGTGEGGRHGVSAAVFAPGPALHEDERSVELFLRRAEAAARLAAELPDAPSHPAGSFPLVIDYALAKGLAHEAFGHAAEADGFRSSVLARGGRYRTGDRVGAEHVSIVDEPLEGDHAWQPFSANGLVRRSTRIVNRGRLDEALSDPWSASPGGVPLTGAARAESFQSAPLPRMTNIRIEVDDPLPAPGRFEDYTPERVRALLQEAGVFRRHPTVVFLSGYSGGQVNTATGDFVFQCKAIYDLSPEGIRFFKPAIFSGSMFGALNAIREAFGPLQLDAMGYCGKWGQSVPSSGGSHYFLTLDPDPTVLLGGS